MRIRWIFGGLLLLMIVGLAVPAWLAGLNTFALLVIACGVVWMALLLAGKYFTNVVFFCAFIAFSAMGVFREFPLPLLLAVVCFDLAAWNLSNLAAQMAAYDQVFNQRQLENNRLRRLGTTLGGAYLLGLIPIFAQIRFNFLVLLFLGLSATFLLGQGLISLRKENKSEVDE
jgi:hypothetical protein